MADKATDSALTLVGDAEAKASACADDLQAALLLHPEWRKLRPFLTDALVLRDEIQAWLQGAPS